MTAEQSDLRIEYLSIEVLRPNPNNARTHSKKQIRMISRAIDRFGFTNPILISESREIIAGHGRVEAAKVLGLGSVPTIKIEHLSESDRRAYIVADNRLAEKAGWDREILQIELQHIISADIDVEIIGFETAEVDLLLGEVVDRDREPESFDEQPPISRNSPAVTRNGDIWTLGLTGKEHRLLCGDSKLSENIKAVLGHDQAAMLITDVPYNVKISGHVSGKGQTKHPEFAMASGEMNDLEYIDFLKSSLNACVDQLKPSALLYVFIDWRHQFELISAARSLELHQVNLCVWNKTNGGMGSLYRSKHELVWIFGRAKCGHLNNVQLGKYGRSRTNVWDYAGANSFHSERSNDLALHPTVKPVALIADAIRDVTNRRDVVLDPFGGSGTTILAAEKTGRRACVIEIDPYYCDATIRRWEKLTGKQALLLETNETFEEIQECRRDFSSRHEPVSYEKNNA